jgi:hypothetical protein
MALKLPQAVADDRDGAVRPATAAIVLGREDPASIGVTRSASKYWPLAKTPSTKSGAHPAQG